MSKEDIGKRIRLLRKKHKMTINEFSEFVDISPTFLGEIELAKKGMTSDTIIKLCLKCNVSSDYLLLGSENLSETDTPIAESITRLSPKYYSMLHGVILNFIEGIEKAEKQE